MKNKKLFCVLLVIFIILIALGFILIRGLSGEDTWIKDSRGIWIEHGNPLDIPDKVLEQQQAIFCANDLYNQEKENGTEFKSQCLGICGNYAIDVVSVPRVSEDNLIQNQCEEFRNDKVDSFIELDKEGNIVRII